MLFRRSDDSDKLYRLTEDGRSVELTFANDASRGFLESSAVVENGFLVSGRLPDASDLRSPVYLRPDIYRLMLGQSVESKLVASSDDYAFVGSQESYSFKQENQTIWETPVEGTASLIIDASDRTGVVTFDLGTPAAPTAFPLGGIKLKVADGFKVRLFGQATGTLHYHMLPDGLSVSVDGLKLTLTGSTKISVEDQVSTSQGTWDFTANDDQIVVDRVDEQFARLEEQTSGIQFVVSSDALTQSTSNRSWTFNTKMGKDSVAFPPLSELRQSIVVYNDFDASSHLEIHFENDAPLTTSSTVNGELIGEVASDDYALRFNMTSRPYYNLVNRFDVNGDGKVIPLDALRIINFIARRQRSTSVLPGDGLLADVSGDGVISSLDALRVINEIARRNSNRPLAGDGESATPVADKFSPPTQKVTNHSLADSIYHDYVDQASLF